MAAKQKYKVRGLIYLAFSVSAGIAAANYGQPWIHNNQRAIDVIVTVFSILAGFLVATMTIIGDPAAFGRRSWRVYELQRHEVRKRLTKQKWLFILYLVTLGIIFFESLLSKAFPELAQWMERCYLGLSVTAFLMSIRLPGMLMKIQLSRHDSQIEQKRSNPDEQSNNSDL